MTKETRDLSPATRVNTINFKNLIEGEFMGWESWGRGASPFLAMIGSFLRGDSYDGTAKFYGGLPDVS